ncbi:hypothetical protein M422DRAFT_27122 [Sphaerobolus stellatus SS14]|nr:hypothetical protein M422DRAFT_27122 [Sphaerobolus stellatus SS14]
MPIPSEVLGLPANPNTNAGPTQNLAQAQNIMQPGLSGMTGAPTSIPLQQGVPNMANIQAYLQQQQQNRAMANANNNQMQQGQRQGPIPQNLNLNAQGGPGNPLDVNRFLMNLQQAQQQQQQQQLNQAQGGMMGGFNMGVPAQQQQQMGHNRQPSGGLTQSQLAALMHGMQQPPNAGQGGT